MTTRKYSSKELTKDFFEKQAWSQNNVVCGIDEVGRGCLAGPVVVAAAILPQNCSSRLLKDSKELDSDELITAYKWIVTHCQVSWAALHHRSIDSHNIYQATLIAMKRALMQLCASAPQLPSHILVDAMPVRLENTSYADIEVAYFIKGERKSRSIAAASIFAKVTRDQMMRHLDAVFPGYKLGQHKGYSTVLHKNLVAELGHSIIHRKSFLHETIITPESEHTLQQTIY